MRKCKLIKKERKVSRRIPSYIKQAFLLTCMMLLSVGIYAQNILVKGIVLDSQTREPIIGGNVLDTSSAANGTITDIDGQFSISVPKDAVLKISYIGYIPQEIKVTGDKPLEINLKEDSKTLSEVVVVGFGTQKKENLTGAVGIATAKDIQDRPVAMVAQALQGLVPGLNISQNSGSLEDRASINIRGRGTIDKESSSSPLVLIDGVEADINALNPQDIDNISVLKDAASASIYGSKASFGVIMITTKKGKEGKTRINYNNNLRWNKPITMPRMMDSYSFALYFNDANINGDSTPYFTDDWLQRIKDYQDGKITTETLPLSGNSAIWDEGYSGGGNANYDYYKEFFRSFGFSQEHNVSFSGGTDRFNYYSSFNVLDQSGLMKLQQDKYARYGVTTKLGYDITSWAKVNYTNRFMREKNSRPSHQTNNFFRDVARQGWPMLPINDPNGHIINQWVLRLKDGGQGKKETDHLYQQAQFVFEPIKNWVTNGEIFYTINQELYHWETKETYVHDVAGNAYPYDKSSGVHEETFKDNQLTLNLYTSYLHTLAAKHNFKGMLGTQYFSDKNTKFGFSRDGLLSPNHPEGDLTTGQDYDGNPIVPLINGSRGRYVTQGFFGRLNYDYDGKYLAELNLRYDGSSRYRNGSRWVWSPSFSLGWNIARENFGKTLEDVVGTLKLRGSYGQLANQNTKSWYPTYSVMDIKTGEGTWIMNGIKPNIAKPPGTLENPRLTWEKIQTTNIGLDFGLINNRLTGSFDYFVRKTTHMLGPAPERPVILGVGVPKSNNTDLKDYGFELQIGWQDVLKNGFSYSAKFLLSDNQTKITKYPNITGKLDTYNKGRVVGEIWGYETLGIAKTQEEMNAHLATLPHGGQNALGSNWGAGDIMYADLNGDGKINNGSNTLGDHGDTKVVGNSTPRFQFGLDLNAAWKGFDMRAFFQGVMKRDYWQGSYYFWGAGDGGIWHSTALTDHSNYFRGDEKHPLGQNLNSYYPRPLFGNSKNQKTQTRYLQDASYIRLKNLQIGYTFPQSFTQKFAVSNLRIFFSGENLWTGTSMSKIFDPETISGGEDGNGSAYPLSKIYSFGLSINL